MTTETLTSDNRSRASRLPGIDGLRAIAVGLVIVFHLFPATAVGGYIGVDIFFVISGFLITGLLLREHAETGRIALGNFWRRRARRLLPALALVVLVCSSIALAIGGDVLVGIGTQVLGAATFSYNWLALAGSASYFDETTPELFRNLWSLAVEEQFYLIWPLIILVLVRARSPIRVIVVVLAAAASALAMWWLFAAGGNATRVYYGTDTHSFGLLAGATLALAMRAKRRMPRAIRVALPPLGVLAIVALIGLGVLMATDNPRVYYGGLALVAVLSAVAIAGAIVPGSFLGRALDIAPLRFVGERSYGLYLWHWPVFVLVSAALPMRDLPQAPWMLGAAALAITLVAASLSYRFVELPIRRDGFRGALGRAFTSRTPLLGATALATAIVVGLASFTGIAIAQGLGAGEAQSRIEQGKVAINNRPPAEAKLPTGKEITAIGDSVMLAAAPELTRAFPGIDIDAVVSRQMNQAPALVAERMKNKTMRPILVLSLGTNGPIARSTIAKVKELIGPKTKLVVVNLHVPRDWNDRNNRIINKFGREYRSVEVANWHDAIDPHLNVLSSDQIHPGGPKGGRIYARSIRDALQRLADMPPLQQNGPSLNDAV